MTAYCVCGICRTPLDIQGRVWTRDCGGHCFACMADAGDPECVEAMGGAPGMVSDAALERGCEAYSAEWVEWAENRGAPRADTNLLRWTTITDASRAATRKAIRAAINAALTPPGAPE